MPTSPWTAAALTVGSTVLALVTGCAPISSAINGCHTPSEAKQQELTSHLRSNFSAGSESNRIKEVTFIDAASVALPEDLHRAGATRVLVIRAGVFPENTEGSAIPGVRGNLYLAVDDNDEVIAPMLRSAEAFFDYPNSDEPGWDAYADEVFSSDAASAGRKCAERTG